ncbi:hypothetical protein [Acidithiobacillus ferriphilus]|uniref:hypothetical protein n=1 Tax=Acidithiobacillus ferriphilus TaxID=1689834 RepID=UPI002DB55B89|nr:hypothetical protein [Acidithiobacillus ferriphilus]MEB8476708.1 hypothetical protein [Acidithiobacillus ferriphilus]
MVMIIRFSTLFAVVVIAAKAGIFVADDASLFKNRALEPVEKKVGRLIDEAMRCRGEIEEAADGVADMAQAIASSAVCAIVRVIRVASRTRNRATVAVGKASVIASRAFRSALALARKPHHPKLGGHYESA